jgi:hypothetical protein
MTLFYDQTGPLVTYQNGVLYVSDFNPQLDTKWKMSRWELLRFGLKAIRASCS